jgi:hypothetical protein
MNETEMPFRINGRARKKMNYDANVILSIARDIRYSGDVTE